MNHGSLFSGIGGFDLAADWMGWTNEFHCEINPFGRKVLKYYWPKSISYNDITKTDFTIHRGRIDVLSGGFPCQPFSVAGKQKGTADERHLWPEMLRAIREIQPRYIVGENVSGFVNWSRGMVFEQMQTDLEIEGYEQAAFVLPACAKNAPHRRDRVWIIAHRHRRGRWQNGQHGSMETMERAKEDNAVSFKECSDGIIAHSNNGCSTEQIAEIQSRGQSSFDSDSRFIKPQGIAKYSSLFEGYEISANAERERLERRMQSGFATESNRGKIEQWNENWIEIAAELCRVDDGISERLDGITFPQWRKQSIMAYGNAIVPEIAFEIFKALQKIDHENNSRTFEGN